MGGLCFLGWGWGMYITYYSVQKVKVPASSAQTSSTHCHWLSSIYISALVPLYPESDLPPPLPPFPRLKPLPLSLSEYFTMSLDGVDRHSHTILNVATSPKYLVQSPAFVRKTTRFNPLPFFVAFPWRSFPSGS